MRKIFLLFIVHCSLFIVNCYSQWVQQVSGVTNPLYDCDFVDQNTGWVSGSNGVILKTTNGGLNWFQQPSGVTKILQGIDAVDASVLYCVGYDETILKTTNGGNNWIAIRNGPPMMGNSFFKAFFLNENTGWILGNNYIMRTVNGCLTFDSTFVVFTFLRDIYFKDALTGVLCGDGSLIMKSTDGGVTWNQITIPLHNFGQPDFYRLSFIGNTGWIVAQGSSFGLGKLVYRTTDFGSSWDTIARVLYPIGEENYSVFFSSLNTGYCGGTSGYTFKTTNGGFNWYQQIVPSNGFRRDFNFVNDTLGWSVGGGGQIFKTSNGGTYVAIEPISSTIPKDFKLFQNFPNPFNSQTSIKFSVSISDKYTLEVFDMLGRRIEVILNETISPGLYKINYSAINLSTGIYFYKLSSSDYFEVRKFTLIK
ncbi:MAG: YCF48-related protein [Chlorobi bacterium]|nr:YCF48-related protein [Chlorobiota bacterium]